MHCLDACLLVPAISPLGLPHVLQKCSGGWLDGKLTQQSHLLNNFCLKNQLIVATLTSSWAGRQGFPSPAPLMAWERANPMAWDPANPTAPKAQRTPQPRSPANPTAPGTQQTPRPELRVLTNPRGGIRVWAEERQSLPGGHLGTPRT